jgi:hypothetical protein
MVTADLSLFRTYCVGIQEGPWAKSSKTRASGFGPSVNPTGW